jgi:hypothetical protein
VYGLGDPVLYDTNPRYSYRPRSDQTVRRLGGARVHLNNLGLRADADWDRSVANKVLFLGNSVTYGGSYVSNDELFSHVALAGKPEWVGGNGGVNGWGVENIHGLIVRGGFHPARAYVTVLIEEDFYRGLAPMPPYLWQARPRLALQEVLRSIVANLRAHSAQSLGDTTEQGMANAAQLAVKRLVELDAFVLTRGALHLVYLSPSLANLNGDRAPDERLAHVFDRAGIVVRRLQAYPALRQLTKAQRAALFHDGVHLSRAGHQLWGAMIREDLLHELAMAEVQARKE